MKLAQAIQNAILKPNPTRHIYSNGIDYSLTGKDSIWGPEDELTQRILDREPIEGRWLNVGAGDGRFNEQLLNRADTVVALDIEPSALYKLRARTPESLRTKLFFQVANLIEPLPFDDQSFDGVFSTGTFQLFPVDVLKKVFTELDRVLKTHGRLIFDLSTNITRTAADGSQPNYFPNELKFTTEEAREFLRASLSHYDMELLEDHAGPVPEQIEGKTVIYESDYVLFTGRKRRG